MRRHRAIVIAAILVAIISLGGCVPGLKTSIDFTQDGYEDQVDIEADATVMPSSATADSSEPLDYHWEHQHGLVIRRGRVYTKEAYRGDFRAELLVDIMYLEGEAEPSAESEGFILGIGFKELRTLLDPIPNVFKAVQFYGNHVNLTDSIKAYTVIPHMPYATAVSLEDPAIDFVSPFVKDLFPGLVIGDGIVSGENLIVLARTGETISVQVNGILVGEYESRYKLDGYPLSNLLFDDFDAQLPIKIGVFSGCAHINGENEEGVFLKSLTIYADEILN